MILVGHNITEMRKLQPQSVHCVVCSPPYFGLRAYGTDPQIWGGLEECNHDWAANPKRFNDGRRRNAESQGKHSRAHEAIAGNNQTGDTCGTCGAWRGELGSEPNPEMFISHLVEVFSEVWRVLRDDGVCWMNLGDSYANDGKWGGRTGGKHVSGLHGEPVGRSRKTTGLKPKELIGIPWRAAFALQAAGWFLRSDNIWHKTNVMPESVRDRTSRAHEYVFMLTKSPRYFWDHVAVQEPTATKTLTVTTTPRKGTGTESTGEKLNAWMEANGGREIPLARNLRTVWRISTKSYKGAHFATYPPELVAPCILAGTSARGCCHNCGAPWRRLYRKERVATRPGNNSKVYVDPENSPYEQHSGTIIGNRDPQRHLTKIVTIGWEPTCKCDAGEPVPCTVLDPFLGSGTTATVAEFYGRRWIGCELNEKYAELARARIAEGWQPPKPKSGKKRKRKVRQQRTLFCE